MQQHMHPNLSYREYDYASDYNPVNPVGGYGYRENPAYQNHTGYGGMRNGHQQIPNGEMYYEEMSSDGYIDDFRNMSLGNQQAQNNGPLTPQQDNRGQIASGMPE